MYTGNCAPQWYLGIELNGEWEACAFTSRTEAIGAFEALRCDYPNELARAFLVRGDLLPKIAPHGRIKPRESESIH